MSHPVHSEQVRLDPALAALTAGSRVGGGRFTLLRLLGQGGMGVVWLARDEHLREGVALKFLPSEVRHDATALEDLRRETARTRKLTHPHIIRIHDVFRVEQEAFISMEYVDGPNLGDLLLQQPRRVLKWTFIEPLVKELCDALAYAHDEHVVHRDLKPANMMLDGRGRLKLADFGIAATIADTVNRVSMQRHDLSGTANYMSPQQLDGQPPQVTDDIYSVGATLYELLTSRAPFFTGDIAHQVRTLSPQPIEKRLAQLNIDNPVPSAVSAVIMACLAKDPVRRPQSARSLAEEIGLNSGAIQAQDLPAPEPAPSVPPAPRASATPASLNPPDLPASADPEKMRTSRPPVITVAAIFAILGVATFLWWSSRHRGANPGSQPTDPPAPEFVSIFNGSDFYGWDGDPQVWSVKDGAITATGGTSKERRPLALFWRGGTVQDFELRLSFRIQSGNSGIYYRAKQLLSYEVGGYQFEISGGQTGNLIETGPDRMRREPSRRGSVTAAEVVNGKEKITVERPTGVSVEQLKDAFRQTGWNDVVITVRDNHIIHQLNGRTIIDATDHFEKRPRSGTIAFEVYGAVPTVVQFRDVRLKRFPSPAPTVRN